MDLLIYSEADWKKIEESIKRIKEELKKKYLVIDSYFTLGPTIENSVHISVSTEEGTKNE